VIEFLHRIMDVFEDYFGECTETSLKDNFVIVYEVKNSSIRYSSSMCSCFHIVIRRNA
jgi:hypothetical protein